MKDNKLRQQEDIPQNHLVEWKKEWNDMVVDDECPNCNYIPDCDDTVISYSSKKYSYHLSLLSSFPQYTWIEMHKCPKCDTLFKVDVESI